MKNRERIASLEVHFPIWSRVVTENQKLHKTQDTLVTRHKEQNKTRTDGTTQEVLDLIDFISSMGSMDMMICERGV